MTIAARIAALERELADVRRLQREADAAVIARSVRGCVFSAAELLAHARVDPDLHEALHGATTPRQVGRRLAQLAGGALRGVRIVRLPRNGDGCIWTAVLHDGTPHAGDDGV